MWCPSTILIFFFLNIINHNLNSLVIVHFKKIFEALLISLNIKNIKYHSVENLKKKEKGSLKTHLKIKYKISIKK